MKGHCPLTNNSHCAVIPRYYLKMGLLLVVLLEVLSDTSHMIGGPTVNIPNTGGCNCSGKVGYERKLPLKLSCKIIYLCGSCYCLSLILLLRTHHCIVPHVLTCPTLHLGHILCSSFFLFLLTLAFSTVGRSPLLGLPFPSLCC